MTRTNVVRNSVKLDNKRFYNNLKVRRENIQTVLRRAKDRYVCVPILFTHSSKTTKDTLLLSHLINNSGSSQAYKFSIAKPCQDSAFPQRLTCLTVCRISDQEKRLAVEEP